LAFHDQDVCHFDSSNRSIPGAEREFFQRITSNHSSHLVGANVGTVLRRYRILSIYEDDFAVQIVFYVRVQHDPRFAAVVKWFIAHGRKPLFLFR